MDSKQYTYRVMWSAEDNEYVGQCAEFPSLSWLDADQSKAFSGIVNVVAEVVADMISITTKDADTHAMEGGDEGILRSRV